MAFSIKSNMLWLAFAVLQAAVTGSSALAGELASPSGEVVLTVSGSITNTNHDGAADFDMPMLEALAHTVVTTATPWTAGATTFDGVSLTDLLAAVGAPNHGNMTVTALNDYSATVPVEDAQSGAILAYKINGDYFSIREKGPLWLMYPFDTSPQLKREEVYARSVWQIRKINVAAD